MSKKFNLTKFKLLKTLRGSTLNKDNLTLLKSLADGGEIKNSKIKSITTSPEVIAEKEWTKDWYGKRKHKLAENFVNPSTYLTKALAAKASNPENIYNRIVDNIDTAEVEERVAKNFIGSYEPNLNLISINPQSEQLFSDVLVHELGHVVNRGGVGDFFIKNILKNEGTDFYRKNRNEAVLQPEELRSIIQQVRRQYKLDPLHKYNVNELNNLKIFDENGGFPWIPKIVTPEGLEQLFDIAQNKQETNYVPTTKNGGYINKFKNGGKKSKLDKNLDLFGPEDLWKEINPYAIDLENDPITKEAKEFGVNWYSHPASKKRFEELIKSSKEFNIPGMSEKITSVPEYIKNKGVYTFNPKGGDKVDDTYYYGSPFKFQYLDNVNENRKLEPGIVEKLLALGINHNFYGLYPINEKGEMLKGVVSKDKKRLLPPKEAVDAVSIEKGMALINPLVYPKHSEPDKLINEYGFEDVDIDDLYKTVLTHELFHIPINHIQGEIWWSKPENELGPPPESSKGDGRAMIDRNWLRKGLSELPTEISTMRKLFGFKPDEVITEERLKPFLQHSTTKGLLNSGMTIEQLIRAFNTFAYNDSSTQNNIQFSKNGGQIKKFQNGGQRTPLKFKIGDTELTDVFDRPSRYIDRYEGRPDIIGTVSPENYKFVTDYYDKYYSSEFTKNKLKNLISGVSEEEKEKIAKFTLEDAKTGPSGIYNKKVYFPKVRDIDVKSSEEVRGRNEELSQIHPYIPYLGLSIGAFTDGRNIITDAGNSPDGIINPRHLPHEFAHGTGNVGVNEIGIPMFLDQLMTPIIKKNKGFSVPNEEWQKGHIDNSSNREWKPFIDDFRVTYNLPVDRPITKEDLIKTGAIKSGLWKTILEKKYFNNIEDFIDVLNTIVDIPNEGKNSFKVPQAKYGGQLNKFQGGGNISIAQEGTNIKKSDWRNIADRNPKIFNPINDDKYKTFLKDWYSSPRALDRLSRITKAQEAETMRPIPAIHSLLGGPSRDEYAVNRAKGILNETKDIIDNTKGFHFRSVDDQVAGVDSLGTYLDWSEGFSRRGTKDAYFVTALGNPQSTTPLHEMVHNTSMGDLNDMYFKGTPGKVLDYLKDKYGKDADNIKVSFGLFGLEDPKLIKKGKWDSTEYLSKEENKEFNEQFNELKYIHNQNEVYPRIMQLRYKGGFKPDQVINKGQLKQFENNEWYKQLQRLYREDDIIRMFNDMVSNQRPEEIKISAQNGGQINKFQGGGKVKKFQWGGVEEEEKLPGKYDRDQEPIINSWNDEFLKGEGFKSGELPTRYNLDNLAFKKRKILDFSVQGLPKDWRQRINLFEQSREKAYLPGDIPRLSSGILNKEKVSQEELGEKLMEQIKLNPESRMFKLKHFTPLFKKDEWGDFTSTQDFTKRMDASYANTNYRLENLSPEVQKEFAEETVNSPSKDPRFAKTFGHFNEVWLPLYWGYNVHPSQKHFNYYEDTELTSTPSSFVHSKRITDPVHWGDKYSQYYIRGILSKDRSWEGVSNEALEKFKLDLNKWMDEGATMFINDAPIKLQKSFYPFEKQKDDRNYKTFPAAKENSEYVRNIVSKMKGVPSLFKHDVTPLEELFKTAPSLYSGAYGEDQNLPFSAKGRTLKDLAEKETFTEEEQQYINEEMLKAQTLNEQFKVKNIFNNYINGPRFLETVINRNFPEGSPEAEEFRKQTQYPNNSNTYLAELSKKYKPLVEDIKTAVVGTGHHIQEDYRGPYGNMLAGVPYKPQQSGMDLIPENMIPSPGGSIMASGFTPEATSAHEYGHLFPRLNFDGAQNQYKNIISRYTNPEVVHPEYDKFLSSYEKGKVDPYWDSREEFESDLYQLLYNLSEDPLLNNTSYSTNFKRPMTAKRDVQQIEDYVNSIRKQTRLNQGITQDPVMARVGLMWANSTPEQKKQFVNLFNKYFAEGGKILKYQNSGKIINPKTKEEFNITKESLKHGAPKNWFQRKNDQIQNLYEKNKPEILNWIPALDIPGEMVSFLTGHSDPEAGLAIINPFRKAASIKSLYKFPKEPINSPLLQRAKDYVDSYSIGYFDFNKKQLLRKELPKSYLMDSRRGYDYIFPEGVTHDKLNEFGRRHRVNMVEPFQVKEVYKALEELNPILKNVNLNLTDKIQGVASNIHPNLLRDLGPRPSDLSNWEHFSNRIKSAPNEGYGFIFPPEIQKDIMKKGFKSGGIVQYKKEENEI